MDKRNGKNDKAATPNQISQGGKTCSNVDQLCASGVGVATGSTDDGEEGEEGDEDEVDEVDEVDEAADSVASGFTSGLTTLPGSTASSEPACSPASASADA